MNIAETIMDMFAPHECLQCTAEGALLCASCCHVLPTASSVTAPAALDDVFVLTPYEGVAKQLLHGLKFGRQRQAARAIAAAMASRIPDSFAPANVLVTYAPTATSRVRQRGYDQSELIARHIAKQLGRPYASLLGRMGQHRQLGQDRLHRSHQMKQAFRLHKPIPAANTSVLIVDDVLTTGSTLAAAARVLRAGGAGKVYGAVFASA